MPSCRLPALLVALAALGLTAPSRTYPDAPPATAEGAPSLPYVRYQLANGLTVILHQDRTVPLVAVHVQYDVGSRDEPPGRTGFAHLFEHLMFQGTVHLPKGESDRLVEAAGGTGNGSTSQDTTVYWEQAPSGALDQLLYIQSERMGWLLPALTQEKLDNQRDVVRNERRQRIEMAPYGLAYERILQNLWAPGFPYSWMPIGSHEDLERATLEDVSAFFRQWYGPENAVLVVAGDLDLEQTKATIQRWFGPIPTGGRPVHARPAPAPLGAAKQVTLDDRVQLPRLYLAWQSPAVYAPGDATLDLLGAILTDGKGARLVKRLVMDEQIAQGVSAGQASQVLASTFSIVAVPKPGVATERLLAEIDQELERIAATPPTEEELQRAKNKYEAGAVYALEPVTARAAALAAYQLTTGDPGYLAKDLARYKSVTAEQISAAARTWLREDARVILTVIPAAPTAAAPAPAAAGGDR
ncbi:MAG: pitrilysin family protein [Anaeromyxobacter sp.]